MAQLTDDCFAFGGPLMSVETAEAEIARLRAAIAEAGLDAEGSLAAE